MPATRSRAARLLATAALGAACLHCGGSRAKIETAAEQAIRFLAEPAHLYSHAGYYFVYFLQRRFDIAALAQLPDQYRAFQARGADRASGVDLFERLIDPATRLPRERLASVPHPVDRFTIEALYCDQFPVSDGYGSLLQQMIAKGGYELTHVALAIGWLEENHCDPRLPAALRAQVAQKMAAGVRIDGRLDDFELESAAFLYYLGRGDLVPRGFPASILEAQNVDGGWAEEWSGTGKSASNWHPTAMALWILMESEGRGNGAPMIPPRSSG